MSGRADDGPTTRPSLLQLCPMTCLPTKGRGLRALQGLGKLHMGLAGGRGHILAEFLEVSPPGHGSVTQWCLGS